MTASTPAPTTQRSGILLVDKPAGFTSHDVVARIRRLAGTRKVGHAGTLDPLATGLLVLGLNSSTRLLTYLVGLDKEYEAVIRLGTATTTDDSEGEVLCKAPESALAGVDEVSLAAGVATLTGEIMQVPSAVSAIKIAGKRAYQRVREGEEVRLEARPVTISRFDLLERAATTDAEGGDAVDLRVRVSCSSGTYIRALARDLGEILGTGGHLTALRRTRVGPFRVTEARSIDAVEPGRDLIDPAVIAATLFSVVKLDSQQSIDLGQGKRIRLETPVSPESPVAALNPEGVLIGLIMVHDHLAKVLVNFPSAEQRDQTTIAGDAPRG